MVTATETRVETRQITLEELGRQLGIPIKVRPWWGSRRTHNNRVHVTCGALVFDAWNFERRIVEPWCSECRRHIPEGEIKIDRVPHTWLCSRVRYPEVQNSVVVFWEGACGMQGHTHQQNVEVIDVADTACLVKLRAGVAGRNFLIGKDDGHPFATAVVRWVTTVQDAFDWLVPKLVREAYILGKEVKRQGDWYFIPNEREPAIRPANYGGPLFITGSIPALYTNRLYQNVPLIYNGVQTRHIGELVVYKGLINTTYGAPRVKGEVRAPDHPVLILDTWHIGVRSRSGPGSRPGNSNPGLD